MNRSRHQKSKSYSSSGTTSAKIDRILSLYYSVMQKRDLPTDELDRQIYTHCLSLHHALVLPVSNTDDADHSL